MEQRAAFCTFASVELVKQIDLSGLGESHSAPRIICPQEYACRQTEMARSVQRLSCELALLIGSEGADG